MTSSTTVTVEQVDAATTYPLRGRLLPGMAIAAPALGGLFVAESVRSWMPGAGADQPELYQDSEADDE